MNQTGSVLIDCDHRKSFVGPYAQPQLFLTPDGALSPFATTLSSAAAIISHQLNMYARGEIADFQTANITALCWKLRVSILSQSVTVRRGAHTL